MTERERSYRQTNCINGMALNETAIIKMRVTLNDLHNQEEETLHKRTLTWCCFQQTGTDFEVEKHFTYSHELLGTLEIFHSLKFIQHLEFRITKLK